MTSPGAGVASSQYRSRWKAAVGSATRRVPRPVNSADQSTSTPATCSAARASVSTPVSGRPVRAVGASTAGGPVRQPWASAVRTASGPSST